MPKRKAAAADLDAPPRRSKRLASKERAEQDQQDKEPEHEESQPENPPNNESQDAGVKYPNASLLGIPGELRNRIYRYALVNASPIKVTKIPMSHQYPSLVIANRQIYNETKSIFLMENQFDVAVVNYEPRVPLGTEHWIFTVPVIRLMFNIKQRSWANLKEWIRKWHTGKHVRVNADGDVKSEPRRDYANTSMRMAVRAFQIVAPIKELPWSKLEAVL